MDFFAEEAPRQTWPERIRFLTVAAVCSVALLAGALWIADRLSHPHRWLTSFNHGVWLSNHGARTAMLPDLLRRTCPGMPYREVIAELGPPDSPESMFAPELTPRARTIGYDVDGDQFYVEFRLRGTQFVVYYVILPSFIGYPARSCWT